MSRVMLPVTFPSGKDERKASISNLQQMRGRVDGLYGQERRSIEMALDRRWTDSV